MNHLAETLYAPSPFQRAVEPFSASLLSVGDDNESVSDSDIEGATVGFLRIGELKLLVTASHVWNSHLERRQRFRRYGLCLSAGGEPIWINGAHVVGSCTRYDVVTLACPSLETADLGAKRFFETPTWPPTAVVEQEWVGFIGFPRDLRLHHQPGRVETAAETGG